MYIKNINSEHFDPFPLEMEPEFSYDYEGLDLRVYYLDNYEKKREALEQQPTFIYTRNDAFYVLLEKQMYDMAPELYSKEVLAAQCRFYSNNASKHALKIIGGGVGITLIGFLISNIFMGWLYAIMLSMAIGVAYMMFMLFRTMKNDMIEARYNLRQELIELLGEEQLDSLLKRQEAYAKSKGFEY